MKECNSVFEIVNARVDGRMNLAATDLPRHNEKGKLSMYQEPYLPDDAFKINDIITSSST